MPQARLGIQVLARVTEVEAADAVDVDVAVERLVVRLPDHRPAGVRRQLRPSQVVGVEVVDLVVAHQRHRFIAVPEVAGPAVRIPLREQLVLAAVDVRRVGHRRAGLGHPLVQRIHRVGRGHARAGVACEPAEWIVSQRVRYAVRARERRGVADGVGGVGAAQRALYRVLQAVARARVGVGGVRCRSGVAPGDAVAGCIEAQVISRRQLDFRSMKRGARNNHPAT